MKTYLRTILVCILISVTLLIKDVFAQQITQVIKGTVFDNESKITLPGANIIILGTDPIMGGTTDMNGSFRIPNVPVGRYNVKITYVGYQPTLIPELMVGSGKEVVLNIALKESVNELQEVVIKARKDKPLNSMAAISARSFTVEETRRYAGSLDDPARMASVFAGVTVGNFGDNAIIIRGNSPKNLSWRLEGVDIPGPSHFAGANLAGGGFTTIFSSQLLANSDFYTGAFPAEYGNTIAGVFDMKLRNGNNEQYEHTFQVGLMGIDIASEGPLKQGGNSSYLFNYRYSTLGLLTETGIFPMDNQISKYQDLSFKLNFPTKKKGIFSIWGISSSDNVQKTEEMDSTLWTNEWNRTNHDWMINMGTIGLSHKLTTGSKTFIKSTIAASGISNKIYSMRLDSSLNLNPNWENKDISGKIVFSTSVNHKMSNKLTWRTGFTYNALFYNIETSSTINNKPTTFQNFINEDGYSSFLEYYFQFKYDITDNLSFFSGVNASYLALNDNYSIDPRFSLKWKMNDNNSLNFGFGKHSQREDLKIYFIQNNTNNQITYPNKGLKLSQALHVVMGYDWSINEKTRVKIEPYYQYLYDIPGIPDSSYSLINYKQDWVFRDSLQNNTFGINKGIDLTIERFLSNNYYYLISASLFDSKYKADDGVWRNTRYNKSYVLNFVVGKEFTIRNKNILGINGRFSFTGGERVSPILQQESVLQEKVVYDESRAFENQMSNIKYLDVTITYRVNKAKYSGVWALQIKNLLGEPYGEYQYNFKDKRVEKNNVVVILPALSYKIEF